MNMVTGEFVDRYVIDMNKVDNANKDDLRKELVYWFSTRHCACKVDLDPIPRIDKIYVLLSACELRNFSKAFPDVDVTPLTP